MSICRLFFFLLVAVAFLLATGMPTTSSDLIVGRNVNMVSGTDFIGGDPYLQRQNEPSIAVSTRNPLHLLAGANDYRTIDIPFLDELPGIPEGTAARDAWVGVFKSIDGGESWTSTLLPGYPQDPEGTISPIYGYDAACDPVVRAGTNGLFYYSGIAFNREERGAGVVFVARFIDNNNIEAPETIEYIDTNIVDQGNAGQFLDMPSIAVDLPRGLTTTGRINTAGNLPQDIPCGNVYITYSVFLGNTIENVRSRILFARSADCGLTWTKPIKLSESQHIIQRPKVAIDPSDPTGGTVYVAFRRFAHGKEPDAIVIVRSTDGGQTFTKPIEVAPINPFDQGTSIHSFRTNGYPTLTVDNNGIVYLAWSQRVGALPQEEARIMLTTSTDGQNWPDPWVVDNSGIGHQFMPSLTCIGGKLMMAWYDQRNDIAIETNPSYFTKYIEDSLCRHTIDVRVAQAEPGPYPTFGPAKRVTRYLYLLKTDEDGEPIIGPGGYYWEIEQVQFNPPNYPLFQMGTVPFHGDYMEIVSLMFLPTQSGGWTYNTDYSQASVFHTTWTDNRDVVPPGGDWWGDWTNYAQWPLYSRPNNDFELDACINALNTGMRNQNVYTSAITEGIIVGSPGNSKQLDLERTFVVFVKNTTAEERSFRLMIDEPSGVSASFKQFEDMEELDVTIGPYSTISRTVYVTSSNLRGSVRVNVKEINEPGGDIIGGLEGYVVLNPDPTNPDALDPNADPLYYEVHNPRVENPRVENYAVIDELNTNLINPRVENVDLINSGYISPRVENPRVENPRVENLNIVNPRVENPRVENPRVENTALTDVVWTVTNEGNTTSAYTFTLLSEEADEEGDFPGGLIEQVLIYKIHTTPIASAENGCDLVEVHHDELVTVISNPRVENPRVENPRVENPRVENPRVENATVNLAPGEEALFVLRIYDPIADDEYTIEDVVGTEENPTIGNAATAHAVDTEDVIDGITTPTVSYSGNYTPAIGYSPSSMAFTASEGGPNPAAQTLQIQNSADGMLSYAITDEANWLEISPADGIVFSGDPANNHTVSVNISGLTEGTYNAEITIVGYGASNTPQTIPVVLTISSVGALNKLVFIQHPSGGVGDIAWSTQPQVEVQDAAGYRIINDNSTEVSLTIDNNPSSGTLSGTTAITVVDGVATFNNLSIDKGGYGYTLEASSPGLLPDTSEPFNIEGFSDTGSMNAERSGHTATFLVNDKVLIAGGAKSPFLQSAEIYEPSTGSFTNLGNVMTAHRYNHTATTLLNNKVLITGGDALTGTAEIFDPADNSFSPTGSMNHHRSNHGATLLQDGRILIIGASPPWGNTAEIYDPESGTFILVTDTMGEKNRSSHTSTLLPNGKVLIAGGLDFSTAPAVVHVNAYLFNSATEEFTLIGDMPGDPRYGHTATLLNDGTVLIAGGNSAILGNALNTALIYDPYDGSNGSFTLLGTNMNDGHFGHQAALLRDGKVLLMGDTAEIYDPDTQQFYVTGQMAQSRQDSAAAVLQDGKILVTGGSAPETNSAEIWNPIEPFPTHVISGTITYNSSGVGGVLLDGLPGYPITNYGGYYEGLVLDGWSGTVTPAKDGYTFSPTSRTYPGVTGPISGEDYTATLQTYTISGTVSGNLEGVVMSGLPANPQTGVGGTYSDTVDHGWSGTVIPTLAGYTFSPSSRTYSNVTTNQIDQDYTPTAITPAPEIWRLPSSMTFIAEDEMTNPSSQTLEVKNSGGDTLSYTITDDAGWLSVSPESGTSTGDPANTHTVSVDISGLSAALSPYTATITITAPGASNTPQTVSVTLTIYYIMLDESNANKWFGGDNRPHPDPPHDIHPRNVGVGQSIILPSECYISSVGFKFGWRFDYYYNPDGYGHEVTLVLNVRSSDGTIIKTVEKVVPAEFDGGWVDFDIEDNLSAGKYIFTCYLVDGEINHYCTGVLGHTDNTKLPNSDGYSGGIEPGEDIEDWGFWHTHLWDFNFRMGGTGLVAHYSFNGDANDVSGNGNHGTVYGGATYSEDWLGNPNGAIVFDGVDDYVELPNESNFDLTTWSIVAVVKVPDYSIRNPVISKGDNFGNYTLHITPPDGKPYITFQVSTGNSTHWLANEAVPINQFVHIAATYNYSTRQLRGYINGIPKATITTTLTPLLNNGNATIGLSPFPSPTPNEYFIGTIDDIRIYNIVLSESEIESLYLLNHESYEFVTKWGSQGTEDGQFDLPFGIAVDSSGNVYVADRDNHRIQKFDSNGNFVTKWGIFGSGDGQFADPRGIAVDSSGNVYVADTYNDRVQKFDSDGTYVTQWGSYGPADAQFYYPGGIAIDSLNVYVADTNNHRIQKFDSDGNFVTKWGIFGSGDGQFYFPFGIAVDSSGNVYVADTNNHRIQKFDSDGNFVTKLGIFGSGDGQFADPRGIAVDSSGNVYVADTLNDRVQKFDSDGNFVTKWGIFGSGDGQFSDPCGIAVDSSGNVYVADTYNDRVQKFKKIG